MLCLQALELLLTFLLVPVYLTSASDSSSAMVSSAIALVELESSRLSLPQPNTTVSFARESASVSSNVAVAPRRAELLVRQDALADASPTLRGGKALIVSLQLSLSMMANSLTTGIITIGIVDIAADLNLDRSLVYWPVLAYNLTSSPLLVPFGAIADVFGARPINLLGSLACGAFVTACGLSRDGNELIAFRCLHGVAGALYLPTAMSIISTALASGKLRNVALASLGLSMVIGYALGLVLGGVLLDTIGWRFGYFLCGGLQIALFVLGLWTIPSTPKADHAVSELSVFQKLRLRMDWIGALISCVCIGMLSYFLAMIAEDTTSIKRPGNIALLMLSVLLIPVFVGWMRYQERRGKPALIPSSLWKTTFTSICIVVTFANAEMQCMELLTSFFFQNVQELSPLQSSLRLLPGLVAAAVINLITGSLVHRVTISWTIAAASILAGIAPLLMAVINPTLPYVYEALPAQVRRLCLFTFLLSAGLTVR